ncbi:4'-phosphopantetheinyl transferase sfp [Aquicella lusitana]|uniref:4'-phosphopantetheinyl transferase n=2 Tax=Aquicella lusitana TaxID=254246 RepID=A0A370GJ11_9COXI|nr:4'-phosphopantetheinyl transferase [Aquicella lusitana]VVC74491.1 4'-phosphopantetheinyl transferase sfp [Aquicella lusitana]
MHLKAHEIHIWSAHLALTPEQEEAQLRLLSPDENERAQRFQFPIHRQHFIAARSTLRKILGVYLNTSPQDIRFVYTEHKKPLLAHPAYARLKFNMAHSHDIAVYAFALDQMVGIDIEKIKTTYNAAIAKRYFSQQENAALEQLSGKEQINGFFRLWSRKEALVKAAGKGLFIPLSSFSVSLDKKCETVQLEGETWTLLSLALHPAYETALASNQSIRSILFWAFFDHSPVQLSSLHL